MATAGRDRQMHGRDRHVAVQFHSTALYTGRDRANEVGRKWAASGPEVVHFGSLLGRPYFGPLAVHYRSTSAHYWSTSVTYPVVE